MKEMNQEELEKARNFLEKNIQGFPHASCQQTSRFLRKIFGLEEIAGSYIKNDEKQFWHALNYDSKSNMYIDLSLDQFSKNYGPINILSPQTKIFEAIQSDTKFQKSVPSERLKTGNDEYKTIKDLIEIYR